jgi:type I restriction enzyme R subunit
VHRDHHVEVARSLYSVPGALIGARVEVRADKALVRIFHRGQLVKVHPRQAPGRRSTDPGELCVLYYDKITSLLEAGEEATVVMTTAKDDAIEWSVWDRDRDAEKKIRARFLDPADPLKFLIVTAKLLTGFDAPVEGVLYLDKPLRAHTLFQAVCRTNRRFTNPLNGQEKLHGLVVDYVGMGNELARAVAVKDTGLRKALPADVDELVTLLAQYVATAMARFSGIDRSSKTYEQLMQAQDRIPPGPDREAFAEEFLRAQGLFEFLWPDTALRPIEADYTWLARIYASIQPTGGADGLLWHRLGAKTIDLVHEHLDAVTIDSGGLETVAIDAGVFEALRQLGLFPNPEPTHAPTVDDVLDKLEQRLARKLAGRMSITCGAPWPPCWRTSGASISTLPSPRSSS